MATLRRAPLLRRGSSTDSCVSSPVDAPAAAPALLPPRHPPLLRQGSSTDSLLSTTDVAIPEASPLASVPESAALADTAAATVEGIPRVSGSSMQLLRRRWQAADALMLQAAPSCHISARRDRREIDGTRRYRQKRRTTGNDDDDDDERLLCCLTDGCDVPFVCAVCLILSAMAAWIALVLGGIFAGLMLYQNKTLADVREELASSRAIELHLSGGGV